jgi:hypothetical protein
MAAMLVIGLMGGVGAQFASAQVQGARARGELERSIEVDRDLQAYRLSVARAEHARLRSAFAAGAVSQQALHAAEAELRAAEVAIARLQLDLAEVRLSDAAPRNEIWAPLVSGRDFVKERLHLVAMAAQEAVRVAEAQRDAVERRVAVGAAGAAVLDEAQLREAGSTRALRRVVLELTLRDEFLKEGLSPEEVTRRLQRGMIDLEIAGARQELRVARERLTEVRRRVAVGLMSEVDLKRAELEVMEGEVALQRMLAEAQRLGRPAG